MSDFEYDTRDVTALHGAFLTLNKDENTAFKLSAATFALGCLSFPFVFRVRPRGIFLYSFFSSASVYTNSAIASFQALPSQSGNAGKYFYFLELHRTVITFN